MTEEARGIATILRETIPKIEDGVERELADKHLLDLWMTLTYLTWYLRKTMSTEDRRVLLDLADELQRIRMELR